jgi:DDE superfamily endonuclease
LADRLEIHYTPKHGSWLNMAEIESGVLSEQCLDRRLPDQGYNAYGPDVLAIPSRPFCRLRSPRVGKAQQEGQLPVFLPKVPALLLDRAGTVGNRVRVPAPSPALSFFCAFRLFKETSRGH